MTFVVLAAALLVLAVCTLLVLHPDYHAGVLGNTGLALIALAAVTRLAGILQFGSEVHITPLGVVLWIGLALFLGRHAGRFLHRSATRGPTWYACRSPAAPRSAPAERHAEEAVRLSR